MSDINSGSNVSMQVDNGVDRKIKKDPPKIKSISEIFTDIFSVQKDKDSKVKPAQITKTDLKLLCSIEKVDDFNSDVIENICKDAQETDPKLECLTEIILNIMESKNSECKKVLFEICIKIASGVWIKKQDDSLDLYKDIFDSANTEESLIQYMDKALSGIFEKRIAGIANMQAEIYSNGQTELDKTQSYEFSSRMNKQLLKRQQRNLRIVGVLWLLEKGKVDPKAVVDYLIIQIDAESSSNTTLHEVSLYLANQYFSSEVRLIRVLSILRHEITTLTQSKSQLEKLVGQKENQILQLQQYQSSQKLAVEKSRQEVLGYQAEIDNLKNQLNNQELDARANRTHLRDSEEKLKAKAFNLLSEDVLEKLKLSLNALARESPKTDTAIHQIELVIEDIERDLQWFKE